MENEPIEASKPSGSKKSWKTICVWGVAIVVLATLSIFYKNHRDSQNALVSNRVIASKNIKLGATLPDNVDQEIDVDLLQKDADSGNQISKDALALYKHKKAAEAYLSLGVPGSEKVPAELDLELLKADGEAGNTEVLTSLI